jgi:prepilin-type N-terminal cleavage/methylation domain-containing protein/prepilin-type processing-associated H-X9-DG protein
MHLTPHAPLVAKAHARSAFTLIELLTVIAIIGILAAIIIPTVGKVRSSARTAKCLSNLRQLAMGNRLHAQDNKDRMVNPLGYQGLSWNKQLEPYLGKAAGLNGDGGGVSNSGWTDNTRSVTNCPSRESGTEVNVASYGWNGAMYHDSSYAGGVNTRWPDFKFSAPPNPSRVIMVGDMNEENNAYIRPPVGDSKIISWAVPANVSRHGSRGNFAFMDGSVRGATLDELNVTDEKSLWLWW